MECSGVECLGSRYSSPPPTPNAPVEACERVVCNFYIDGVRYSDEFLVLERMS